MTTTYSSDSALYYLRKNFFSSGPSPLICGHYNDMEILKNDFNKLVLGEIKYLYIYDSEPDKVPHHIFAGTKRSVILRYDNKTLVFEVEWLEWIEYIFDYKTTLELEDVSDIVEIV